MNIIVSVTTTKSRLNFLFYALQSILNQSYSNYRVVVNLSKESYLLDEGVDEIPNWLEAPNIEVRIVKNYGPYRKLIPLINDVSDNDLIITADDDVLYSPQWIQKIVDLAMIHSNCIVCGRARVIKRNILGRFQNYANWPLVKGNATGLDFLPIGCSGIGYRKNLLDVDFLKDPFYIAAAPTADDIWFRLASLRRNTPIYINSDIDEGNVFLEHGMGLFEINGKKKTNEDTSFTQKLIQKLIHEFANYAGIPISLNDFSWRKSLNYSNSISLM